MAVVLAPIVTHYGVGSIALVTVLAGMIVVAAGVTGLGRAVTFIPWPVIEGFTLGIAAIIFLQQVPAAVGSAAPDGERPLVAAFHAVGDAEWTVAATTLLVTALAAALMIGLPRLHRAIPESLTAVVAATVLVVAAGMPVARIGRLPSHLPNPLLPDADLGHSRRCSGPR
jgi:sulfate permease, SulP family